jgi:hypothetical protein
MGGGTIQCIYIKLCDLIIAVFLCACVHTLAQSRDHCNGHYTKFVIQLLLFFCEHVYTLWLNVATIARPQ